MFWQAPDQPLKVEATCITTRRSPLTIRWPYYNILLYWGSASYKCFASLRYTVLSYTVHYIQYTVYYSTPSCTALTIRWPLASLAVLLPHLSSTAITTLPSPEHQNQHFWYQRKFVAGTGKILLKLRFTFSVSAKHLLPLVSYIIFLLPKFPHLHTAD